MGENIDKVDVFNKYNEVDTLDQAAQFDLDFVLLAPPTTRSSGGPLLCHLSLLVSHSHGHSVARRVEAAPQCEFLGHCLSLEASYYSSCE